MNRNIFSIGIVASSLVLGACAADMSTADMIQLGMSGAQALALNDGQLRDSANQSCAQMDSKNTLAASNSAYAQRLRHIVKGLPSTADGASLNYQVYLAKDVNAWAMPNGCIRVYSGLMDVMSDDEVRGVLGHEIGHVDLGHSKNRYRVAAAAAIGREALSRSSNSTVARLSASEVGDLTQKFLNAQFSQQQELAADDYSYHLHVRQGLNPRPIASSFDKLTKLSGGGSTLFSSHPGASNRAERIRQRIAQDGK